MVAYHFWRSSLQTRITLATLLLFMLLCGLSWPRGAESAEGEKILRVGVYNFAPIISIDAAGKPQGLYIDLLEHVAAKEGWKLNYVKGSWQASLDRIQKGEIDLQPSIGRTPARDEKLDFNQEAMFVDWGVVYNPKGRRLENVTDLEGKRIAVLKGSIYSDGLKQLLAQFGIGHTIVEKGEYADVLRAIELQEVDAGIITKVSGLNLEGRYPGIEATTIFFSPVKILFAVPQGQHGDVVVALDRHFSALKADRSSIYYELHDKWVGGAQSKTVLPPWLPYALGGLILLVALLVISRQILQRQVAERTRHLEETTRFNEQIIADAQEGIIVYGTDLRYRVWNPHMEWMSGVAAADVIGKAPQEAFPFLKETEMIGNLRRILDEGITITTELPYHVESSGRKGWAIDRSAPLRDGHGNIVGVIGIVTDITERKLIEQALRQSEAELRESQRIAQIGGWRIDLASRRLSWTDETFDIHELPVGQAPTLEQAVDFYLPESRQVVEDAVKSAIVDGVPFDLELQIRTARGNLRWVQARGEAHHHKGTPSTVSGTFQDITPRKQLQSMLEDRQSELEDLYNALQTLREDERSRVAREMHDELGHLLTAMRMDLEWIDDKLPKDGSLVASKLASAIALSETVVDAVRRIMEELRPPVLDEIGLMPALEVLVASFTARTDIRCELISDLVDVRLVGALATDIYRIVQEALNNVMKHAGARRASVTLRQHGEALLLAIEDDGKGFDQDADTTRKPFGIKGMRERVTVLGGTFSAKSVPGQGVRIEALIPNRPAIDAEVR